MKIGVIGAGNWGKNIVKTLDRLGVLSGIAEESEALRKENSITYPDQKIFHRYRDLLKSDVNAVAIATPVPTHYQIAEEALEAGKDVFVEKPMTFTVEEAENLVECAEKNNRILMAGHLLLYQPAVQWMKEYISTGKLGKVYSLHQERSKLGRVRSAENVLWSFGVHDIAVLLYLSGGVPNSIDAFGQCVIQEKIEDDVYLHITFDNDIKAHLHNSWLWPEVHRELIVIGEKGMLVYDELKQTVSLHQKTVDPSLAHFNDGEKIVFEGSGEPLKIEMEHFIECIRDRKTPRSDGRNGLEVIKVLEKSKSNNPV